MPSFFIYTPAFSHQAKQNHPNPNPRKMAPVIFAAGDEVEVMSQDKGFEGSMFGARIVKLQSNLNRYLIEYETLVDDAVPAKNLRETVDGAHIRPRPPRRDTLGFQIGEKVDASYIDGWWVGEISMVLEGGKRYMVRFRVGDDDDDEMEFGFDEVRVHLDWINGEWIGQKISPEDKFTVSQNLCETEADVLKRLMRSISIAHESQIPLRSSMLTCSNDENSRKSQYSAANLDGINSEKSRLDVHLESSQPCKKPKNREAIQSNVKFNRSLLARGFEIPCVLETGFKVATPLIEETSNLHPEALMDCSQCATSPSNENRLLNPDIVTNTVSNNMLEETNGELIFPDNIRQQSVQHTPSIYEPSLPKEEYDKLGDMGSVNEPNVANFDEPTNHYAVKDVQQLIKKAVAAPRQGCKVPFCGGLRQLVTEEKRVIKREIPWEKRMANTVVEKEGIELKQLQKQQDLVVKRSNSLKYFVRKRCKLEDGDRFREIQRENDNQDTGGADEPSNGGYCTSHVETVTPELSDIIVDSNALVQASEDQKEAKDEALTLSGSQVAKRIDVRDRAEANCASHGEEPHDEAGRLPAADQEAKVTAGESSRILTDHTSKKTYLPFTKISPTWTLIESLEVFSLMPQKPHFLPLMQLSKESREGTAIGLMVTYANLVNSVRKLRISDTDHTLQQMMETLIDLERYGFSVQHLQGLLKEFQTINGNHKQLLVRRSALEGLILERRNKKDEFNAKFELMDSVVMRLEQSLECFRDEKASILKQREGNEQEILKLQNDMRAIEESSLAAERSFLNALNALQGSSADVG